MVDDQNLYYNNTECVSAQLTKDANGSGATGPATIFYNHTASFTIPADGAALIHHLWAAPPALNTIDNATSAGINVCAGSSLGDFYAWKASGSDFAPAPRGGWANYAINPAIGTPDHTVGTAPTVYSMIGIGVSAVQQARGNPNACNAVRYGRCEAIFTGGQTADYATFDGYGIIDDTSTNRWNLIEPVGTSGFIIQGLMSLGTTGTLVDFRDSNKTLNIKNTINVTSAFNAIEVNNATSNIEWTAISISALGTISKGTFEVIDNATIDKTSCTFTDMNTFTYQSNSTLTDSIYRRCGQITQDGATFSGCTIDNSVAAIGIVVSNLALITDNTFNSDGTGHAIDLGTIATSTTITWDNLESGYAGTSGSTGNETILVNYTDTGADLTINVATGASTPTVYNTGAGTVLVVAGQATITLEVLDQQTSSPIEGVGIIVRADTTGDLPYLDSVTITQTTGTATVTHTTHGFTSGQYVEIVDANENNYNRVKQLTVVDANSYTYTIDAGTASPATGTITATAVILFGDTNASGIISDTRGYTADQDISGDAKKGSSSPAYVSSPITGTVDSATGASITILMIPD